MSFSIAASELNVTQSAISRQIKTLEDFLGIELFKRLPRSLELTEGGARFAEPLHDAFDQLYEATETTILPSASRRFRQLARRIRLPSI